MARAILLLVTLPWVVFVAACGGKAASAPSAMPSWIVEALGGSPDLIGRIAMGRLRTAALYGSFFRGPAAPGAGSDAVPDGYDALAQRADSVTVFARADAPAVEGSSTLVIVRGGASLADLRPEAGWRAAPPLDSRVAVADQVRAGAWAWRAYAVDASTLVLARASMASRVDRLVRAAPLDVPPAAAGDELIVFEMGEGFRRWMPRDATASMEGMRSARASLTSGSAAELRVRVEFADRPSAERAHATAKKPIAMGDARLLGALMLICPALARLEVASRLDGTNLDVSVRGLDRVIPLLSDRSSCGFAARASGR